MVITSCPLPQNEAERLNTLVSSQPEFTPFDGQFSAGANTPVIKNIVVEILEGTEPAFKNRKRKYGL